MKVHTERLFSRHCHENRLSQLKGLGSLNITGDIVTTTYGALC